MLCRETPLRRNKMLHEVRTNVHETRAAGLTLKPGQLPPKSRSKQCNPRVAGSADVLVRIFGGWPVLGAQTSCLPHQNAARKPPLPAHTVRAARSTRAGTPALPAPRAALVRRAPESRDRSTVA